MEKENKESELVPDPRRGGIRTGMRVQAHDLQGAAHLNDTCGTAVAWEEAKERWQVRFDTSEVRSLKPANLRPAKFEPNDRVKISGLNSAPEFNGTMGTILKGPVDGRWKVHCDYDNVASALREEHLTLVTRETAFETEFTFTTGGRQDSKDTRQSSGFNSSAMDAPAPEFQPDARSKKGESKVERVIRSPRLPMDDDEELQQLLAMEPKRVEKLKVHVASAGTGNLKKKH